MIVFADVVLFILCNIICFEPYINALSLMKPQTHADYCGDDVSPQ